VPPADFQMDQYTSTPFGNEVHDDNGNLTQVNSAAGQTLYAYDYANRLVEVFDLTTGTPTPVVSFTYDVLGQRISKTTYPPAPSAPLTKYYVLGCTHRYRGTSRHDRRKILISRARWTRQAAHLNCTRREGVSQPATVWIE